MTENTPLSNDPTPPLTPPSNPPDSPKVVEETLPKAASDRALDDASKTSPPREPTEQGEDGANEAEEDEDDKDAEESKERMKPWWAIILVAALTAVGTQVATSVFKYVGQKIDSASAKSIKLNFLVLQKSGGAPVAGVGLSLLDPGGQRVIASGTTNEHGALARDISVQYGAYLLEARYKANAIEYARSEQVVFSKPFYAEKLEFDSSEWQETGPLAADARSKTTASGALGTDLPSITQGPPWLGTAYGELGEHAYPTSNNPRIVEYWKSIPGVNVSDDPQHTDWASAFVNWVLQKHGIVGTQSAISRSWLNWGKNVENPRPGCIAVFWTHSPDSPTGHVGFFIAADAVSVTVLGGDSITPDNQGPEVALLRMRRASFLGCREPGS